jgi:hypothetical protein
MAVESVAVEICTFQKMLIVTKILNFNYKWFLSSNYDFLALFEDLKKVVEVTPFFKLKKPPHRVYF